MTMQIRMDHQVMRRSRRHLVLDAKGNLEYAANTFAEAIDYLESIDQRQVELLAGDRRLLIDIRGAFAPVDDPRQLKIQGVLPEKNAKLPSA